VHAELYTTSSCPFCIRAKAILDRYGVEYTEHVMDSRWGELRETKRRFGHPTVPIILLDGEFIGGCDELEALASRGRLD
jgi:glutaredoxin 3